MHFNAPAWLLLLPGLALAAGMPWGRFLRPPLRGMMAALVVIALADPTAGLQPNGTDLWVLADRSASTEGATDAALPEWAQLLGSSQPSAAHRIRWIDFAAEALPRDPAVSNPSFPGNRELTRTALAIRTALALRDGTRPTRFLALTDGFSTESLAGIGAELSAAGVPLDVRFLNPPADHDFAVRGVSLPPRTRPGEPFLIEADITGPADATIPLAILRNGTVIHRSTTQVRHGRARPRFTDQLTAAGSHRYEILISPPDDPRPGNNRRDAWIETADQPRLLLITGYADDPAAATLATQFRVETVTDPATLRPGILTGCRAVFLNNVAAWKVPPEFTASLPFFVETQGGGLLMAGGRDSFGAGGWCQSAADPLLPVSMELREDVLRHQTALAIALDRSGSMSAYAGRSTKMQLANAGAARALALLGPQDTAAVLAVDTAAQSVIPLTSIGSESTRRSLIRRTEGISSGGGGIFIGAALAAAWEQIRTSPAATRHIILFADATDAEEPANYRATLAAITAAGASVSVIALGTRSDPDAALLEEIASLGKGRAFFSASADDLPSIFTAETIAVARSRFLTNATPAAPTGQWQEISPQPLAWLNGTDACNLSYLRPWASPGLVTTDEFAAPLVAWGRRGTGRTAAIAFPLAGAFSTAARQWPDARNFLLTLARWLMGDEIPAGLGLRWATAGTTLTVTLQHDPSWNETLARTTPRLFLASGPRAENQREIAWERIAPGSWHSTTELNEGELIRGAVTAGPHALPFGPCAVGTDTEWQTDPARRLELLAAATTSGGRELTELRSAWLSPPQRTPASLRPFLLSLGLGLFLTEIYLSRTGKRLRLPLRRAQGMTAATSSGTSRQPPQTPPTETTAAAGPSTRPADAAPEIPATPAQEPSAGETPEAERRRARFSRAKKR
jgi:hypothetical protein